MAQSPAKKWWEISLRWKLVLLVLFGVCCYVGGCNANKKDAAAPEGGGSHKVFVSVQQEGADGEFTIKVDPPDPKAIKAMKDYLEAFPANKVKIYPRR